MRANARNEFFFVPDDDLDIWPDGLGFEAIPIKVSEKVPDQAGHDESVREFGRDRTESLGENPVGAPESAKRPENEPRQDATAVPESCRGQRRCGPDRGAHRGLPVWAIVLIVVGVLLVLFVAASYLFTDAMSPILDRLLYTKEELELLQGR